MFRSTAAPNGGSRRALRDVTNANRGGANGGKGGGKSAVAIKRATGGVKTRSQSMGNTEVVAVRPPGAFGNKEECNPRAAHQNQINPDKNSYQFTGTLHDLDGQSDDPLDVVGYVQDIYTHFKERELVTSTRPTYMESQNHINARMRSILCDWLIEVHLKFRLVPETLYLTINLIDRYLELKEVTRPKLQLVGVTALLIASKYEEIYPPELRDLVYICDKAYTKSDILDMEESILKTLEYQITIPSAHAFLVRFLKAGHADKKIVQLSCYILDSTLLSYTLLHYLPSQLAAAAVFIARRTIGRNAWSPTLLKYAEYYEEEIIPVARAILTEMSSSNPELRAVNKKYSSHRYGGVANTVFQCDF